MTITAGLYRTLVEEARAALPREAVGIVCGSGEEASSFVAIPNLSRDPNEFTVDPGDVTDAMDRAAGTPLALFHSHPTDIPAPSASDMAGAAAWPQMRRHLILSLANEPALKCWLIFDGQAMPEKIELRSER